MQDRFGVGHLVEGGDLLAQLQILVKEVCVALVVSVPARTPGVVVAEAKPVRVRLLSHS